VEYPAFRDVLDSELACCPTDVSSYFDLLPNVNHERVGINTPTRAEACHWARIDVSNSQWKPTVTGLQLWVMLSHLMVIQGCMHVFIYIYNVPGHPDTGGVREPLIIELRSLTIWLRTWRWDGRSSQRRLEHRRVDQLKAAWGRLTFPYRGSFTGLHMLTNTEELYRYTCTLWISAYGSWIEQVYSGNK